MGDTGEEHLMTTVSTFAPAPGGVSHAGWHSLHVPARATERATDPQSSWQPGGQLDGTQNILAVIARPGQESADLGALLYVLGRAGASVALLSLTRGEASPVNSTNERLELVRPWEMQVAAGLLGITSVAVADYPDGGLGDYPAGAVTQRVMRAIRARDADIVIVIEPDGRDDDEAAVARAAYWASRRMGVLAAARTWPETAASWQLDLGVQARTARAVQRSALGAHVSQSETLPLLQRRLDLLDDREHLRWLTPGDGMPADLAVPGARPARRRAIAAESASTPSYPEGMSARPGPEQTAAAQTVIVHTIGGDELDYPWATSVRVDRHGNLRVMQGIRQRAYHPCAEWAAYTVRNLRSSGQPT
jgi:LmbE family N-acetylglucosaminyl deacetylase